MAYLRYLSAAATAGVLAVDQSGSIKYAPRAVMNAVYVSPFADLTGTDNGSFCSIWAHRQ